MSNDSMRDRYYPESRFGGFTRVDGTVAFYSRVCAIADGARAVLDIGCGRGAHSGDEVPFRRSLRDLRREGRRVVGIDVDEEASANPFIDEFRLLSAPSWPVESGSFDLCFADCVLEHVPEVEQFFTEAKRVLRPGGHLCIRTTNAWSYVALASRLVPNRMHARVLDKVQQGRQGRDVFPTVYRCNSIPAIRSALARHGFSGVVYGHEAEPSYLGFSSLAYLLGVLHQKVAPAFVAPTLFAFAATE